MTAEDTAASSDPSRKPCAAMHIHIQFDFQEWPVGPRHIGVSEVILYGDGLFVRKDYWIKDPLF
jgi:hypothetical protein